jgi:predicted Holliday junction resolvase-like endonuclease
MKFYYTVAIIFLSVALGIILAMLFVPGQKGNGGALNEAEKIIRDAIARNRDLRDSLPRKRQRL